MIYPVPVVLVACGSESAGYNIITIAWTGTVCADPPMFTISLRPQRHSNDIIKGNGEFVINLTTTALTRAVDWCGVKSGREVDKCQHLLLPRYSPILTVVFRPEPDRAGKLRSRGNPLPDHKYDHN